MGIRVYFKDGREEVFDANRVKINDGVLELSKQTMRHSVATTTELEDFIVPVAGISTFNLRYYIFEGDNKD